MKLNIKPSYIYIAMAITIIVGLSRSEMLKVKKLSDRKKAIKAHDTSIQKLKERTEENRGKIESLEEEIIKMNVEKVKDPIVLQGMTKEEVDMQKEPTEAVAEQQEQLEKAFNQFTSDAISAIEAEKKSGGIIPASDEGMAKAMMKGERGAASMELK